MSRTRTRALGLSCMVFALFCVGVWIPLDTDTGLVETVRRRVTIGDALAPTIAACFVLIGGGVLVLWPGAPRQRDGAVGGEIRFAAAMTAILLAGFVVMLFAGPLAVAVANIWADAPLDYRLLRATAPWKYIGFVTGGTLAISGIICLAERRVTWRALAIAALAVLGMIALFDLPFDDLLLPPNGDF